MKKGSLTRQRTVRLTIGAVGFVLAISVGLIAADMMPDEIGGGDVGGIAHQDTLLVSSHVAGNAMITEVR